MLEAPASALLVEAFANTVDVEEGTDDLSTPAQLADWLWERGLTDRHRRVGADDHELCLRLRAGIREELGTHVGDGADAAVLAAADAALRELPVLVTVGGGASAPAPHLPPARQALARLAIAWAELIATGEAHRLKRCAEHSCAWAFWDVSKNRSRRWCSMRVCGNRTKARKHAAKQAAAAGADTPTASTRAATTEVRP
ncbi:CGNR zinc finger domain-containing protein [Streptomyces sp. LX-29]|uniref:CGNR zinc finger domain-containing protein n=1 Tax=Streptomyces sp. LX-29 TaxID=2900152 RepID=UPI00240D750B|nr:CGNR zinc finger domain-containing protein [Streptomyces sp. LX-29]WFB07818.1 CGNR zinc finger domain-containing protein [Streptomyces sp. LX-29]